MATLIALYLLFSGKRKSLSNIYYAVILLSDGFLSVIGIPIVKDLIVQFPSIAGLQLSWPFLIPPLSFLFLRSLIYSNSHYNHKTFQYLLPFVFVFSVGYIVNMALGSRTAFELREFFYSLKLYSYDAAFRVVIFLYGVSFLYFQYRLFRKAKAQNKVSADGKVHAFTRFFLGYQVIMYATLLIVYFVGVWDHSPERLMVPFFMALFFITIFYFQGIFNKEKETAQVVAEIKNTMVKSSIREDIKDEYVEKIQRYMEESKPYLEKDLSVNKMAGHLSLSPTYVSRVINEKFEKNFLNFVNYYRVEHAKRMLLEDKFHNLTIEGVGRESGFHSRTAFYNAFKKIQKISPGEFVQQHQNRRNSRYVFIERNVQLSDIEKIEYIKSVKTMDRPAF